MRSIRKQGRFGRAVRAGVAVGALALLTAAPALAVTGPTSLEGARQGVGPATPEPGAALLFALGAGAVAWSARRRTRAR